MKKICLALLAVLIAVPAFADDSPREKLKKDALCSEKEEKECAKEQQFIEDRITLQFMTGVLTSETGVGPDIDEINYWQNNFRLGWMLYTPQKEDEWYRGNVEAIVELSGSKILSGYGSYMVGPTFLVRYNFVPKGWDIIPYIQGGAGIVFNDAYETKSQNAIGQCFEFTPQVSAGFRYIIDKNWSFDTEIMFHHISNANTGGRNAGVNAMGGFVGFTYFFDNLWK